MKYYQFHLGDYAQHTGHLDPIEDIAYRRMLDLYYREQAPLPVDVQRIAKLIRMPEHAATVRDMLVEFFIESPEGYRNTRADREIDAYKRMADGGAKGAAKRWLKGADAPPIASQCPPQQNPNANHEPVTNNQEPPTRKDKTRKPRPQSDDFVSVDDLVAEGVDAQVAKDWLRVRKDKQQRTLTKTAWATVKAESVKAGMALDESLREAVARGWAGFKASWLDNSTPQSRPGFVMAEKPLSPAERQMYAASPTRCNDRVKRMMAAELGNNAPHIVDNIIEMDQDYGAPTLLG